MVRTRIRRGGAATAIVALFASLFVFAGVVQQAAPAVAAPGTPGEPSAPTVLYEEDFENGVGRTGLEEYVSTVGVGYTADPYWLNREYCNGFVMSYSDSAWPGTSTCSNEFNYVAVRAKAYALGQLNDPANPETNRALSTNTSDTGATTPNQVMFATDGQLTLPSANGRFVTFSVDSAATQCTSADPNTHPLLRFYFRDADGQEIAISDQPIDPCTNPDRQTVEAPNLPAGDDRTNIVSYGRFAADSSILIDSSSVGIILRNESSGNTDGNDGAIDNIRVLDVTPQLDKSFSPESLPAGESSTLTLTVTNTSELAAKNGWAFTDNLPEGLVIADNPNVGGDCIADVSAPAGGGSIAITNGVLNAGQASCTVTVDVTSSSPTATEPSPKVYENCAANISDVVGIDLPNCATVEFYTEPKLQIEKTSNATADSRVGDVITYTVTTTNVGTRDYTDENPAVVFDDLSGVLDDATYNDDATSSLGGAPSYAAPLLSWSGPLAVGESVELTYSVTLTATGDGNVRNVSWVPDDPGDSTPPACDPPEGGVDPETGQPCATTEQPLPRLTIDKSADQNDLPAVGGQVTYTVVVTNEGPGEFSAEAPATATDDLSDVLDDATFDDASLTASTGTATRSGNTLSWSGALGANESATITYTVTYNAEGDNRLTNEVCVPEDETLPGFPSCDTVTIPGADLTQWKTATASSDPVVAGSTITYTLFFDNDGQAAADVDAVDDLTHVLDDAEITAEPTASSDSLTVTRDAERITITGSVPAGELVTVTYTVTVLPDDERGDSIAANFLLSPGGTPPETPDCVPTDEQAPDCTTTPITSISYSKSVVASETPVRAGTELTYTITLTNTGATAVDVVRDDNLADVLDDATLTGGPVSDTASVTVDGPADGILALRGTLAVGATAHVTYTVTVNPEGERGNNVSNNFLVPPGQTPPSECEPGSDQCTTTPIQAFTVSKTSDAETAQLGQVVTYTITVSNTGAIDFTEEKPASFEDDLSAVLDDATYNGDVTAGAIVDGNELSWSGPLAVGETFTVTYSVTVNDPATGDGVLTNAVIPTAPGGDCDPEGECSVKTPLAGYTVTKSASAQSVKPGEVVTYTVTVTNTGEAPYTAEKPASFSDDLSAVLDDATYNGDVSEGGAVVDGVLTWSGALAVGESIEVTYSVTVNDPISGDQNLRNAVVPTSPGGTCETEGGCETVTPVASYTVAKEANVETALPGDVVTYSVTVTNTGEVDYTAEEPASFSDDLSGVLDDAVYNGDVSEGGSVSGNTLTWEGALAVGQSVVVTYSVTVDSPVTGDFVLRNAVVPTTPGGSCDGVCDTETPLRALHAVKSSDATEVIPGETVTYTITLTNTGQVDYTEDAPASFSDDLSRVLDDATYNGDATSSTGDGVSYEEPGLSWTGPLAVGESVTITYSVTVNDPATGDGRLENAVVTPPGTGGNCEPGSTDPACMVNVPSGSFTIEKSAEASPSPVVPGGTVTYTVTVTNTGNVAYTAEKPASFTDDLSRVLDDATYNGDVSAGGSVADGVLNWSGPLAVGETLQVTYSVTVDDPVSGDFNLRNVVAPSTPGGECVEGRCVTDTPVAAYSVSKAADVQDVALGGVVSYEITVTNLGEVAYTADFPASFTDDLSDVLDDATYNGDASQGAQVSGDTLSWAGPLEVGESVTVTYSVTVNNPATGDLNLRNAVLADGPGGDCAEEGDCVTETPVATYSVVKEVSTGQASIGDRVTFTISVTNTGNAPYTAERPASFTDDLTSSLAIGTYNNDASNGAVYERPVLSWEGALDVGETVEVTYSVTIRSAGEIRNVVVTPDDSGSNCVAGSEDPDCSTTTVVPPPLAITGGSIWIGGGLAGAALIGFGVLLMVRRQQRQGRELAEL